MTSIHETFQEELRTQLEKASVMNNREIACLVTFFSCLIDNPSFSLKKTQETAKEGFSRQFCAKVLVKYTFVQRIVTKALFTTIISQISKRRTILFTLDDTVVFKCGKHIEGTSRWYDHSKGRTVNGFSLVTLGLVVDGQLVFVLPWIVQKDKKQYKKAGLRSKEQDMKTVAAIELIDEVVDWLIDLNFVKRKIVITADSWYSNKNMMNFLRQKGIKCLMDIRSNLSVQVPDHGAIKKKGEKRRGRKRRRFVRFRSIKDYVGNWTSWSSFTEKDTKKRIYYRTVTVTLKTLGRVTVYTYKHELFNKMKFIVTFIKHKRPPTALTVFYRYRLRWRIEEAHRDLKQQFGLGKYQARRMWLISGFIGFIFFGYSFWKHRQFLENKTSTKPVKCPSWSFDFRCFVIREQSVAVM